MPNQPDSLQAAFTERLVFCAGTGRKKDAKGKRIHPPRQRTGFNSFIAVRSRKNAQIAMRTRAQDSVR
jgi:hypothetical protein